MHASFQAIGWLPTSPGIVSGSCRSLTDNFHTQSDGSGGTLVTDPPVSAATDSSPLALLHGPTRQRWVLWTAPTLRHQGAIRVRC